MDELVSLEEWVRRIKMLQDAIREPENQSRVQDLLIELGELEGILGQIFRLKIEGGYVIRLHIELALVEQANASASAQGGG